MIDGLGVEVEADTQNPWKNYNLYLEAHALREQLLKNGYPYGAVIQAHWDPAGVNNEISYLLQLATEPIQK